MIKYTWMYNKIWYGHFGVLMTLMTITQPINYALALLVRKAMSLLGIGKKKDINNPDMLTHSSNSIWDVAANGTINNITHKEKHSSSILKNKMS